MFIFLTDLLKRDVVDRHGRWVGHVFDLSARLEESYPSVTHLIIAKGIIRRKYFVVPWKDVHDSAGTFQLKVALSNLESISSHRDFEMMTLKKSVLDQQVVDTFNRKVVRVNDIHFLCVDGMYRIAHVDIGMRGLMRRLGCERLMDRAVRFMNRHAHYLTDDKLISWKYVQPLSVHESTGKIQLNVDLQQLKQIPPPDISSMLMELDPYLRTALLKTMDLQSQVDIITELELKWQKDLIESLETQAAGALFEKMPADEATDLLAELSKRDADRILGVISTKKAREITELMEHGADTAGGLMTTEFITLREGMTVSEAIDHIRHVALSKAETIYTAFVVDDEGKLTGSVSFRKLLLEPTYAKISDVMQRKPPVVEVGDSVKDVAYAMDKYNLMALPAIGENGELEGIITVDDVLHVAVGEAWGRRSGL